MLYNDVLIFNEEKINHKNLFNNPNINNYSFNNLRLSDLDIIKNVITRCGLSGLIIKAYDGSDEIVDEIYRQALKKINNMEIKKNDNSIIDESIEK